VAVEDKDERKSEDEDKYSVGKSKDEDNGSCRLRELETRANWLLFDKDFGVVWDISMWVVVNEEDEDCAVVNGWKRLRRAEKKNRKSIVLHV
jgi:hypothetical protein